MHLFPWLQNLLASEVFERGSIDRGWVQRSSRGGGCSFHNWMNRFQRNLVFTESSRTLYSVYILTITYILFLHSFSIQVRLLEFVWLFTFLCMIHWAHSWNRYVFMCKKHTINQNAYHLCPISYPFGPAGNIISTSVRSYMDAGAYTTVTS